MLKIFNTWALKVALGGTQVEGADRETDQCDIVYGELRQRHAWYRGISKKASHGCYVGVG